MRAKSILTRVSFGAFFALMGVLIIIVAVDSWKRDDIRVVNVEQEMQKKFVEKYGEVPKTMVGPVNDRYKEIRKAFFEGHALYPNYASVQEIHDAEYEGKLLREKLTRESFVKMKGFSK